MKSKDNKPKRELIGANCTPEFKAQVERFAQEVERRKVADFIRTTLEDRMTGRLVYTENVNA